MDTVLCSITPKKNATDTILYNSAQKLKDVQLFMKTDNAGKDAVGLSEFYNSCLDKFADADYIVFCHDDVDLLFSDVSYQVATALQQFDVAGVAGCVNPKIIEKNLWHWMAQDPKNCHGLAGHPFNNSSIYFTSFGPTPTRVVVLDGVLLALNMKRIKESGVRFDNQFKFHHYDIDFSLTCNKHKLKLGTWPFLINHQSPGLRDFHENWVRSNELFIKKWKQS
jgi:hypothetical protein